ncbi:MAG: flagellar biosynthesis protein FlgM [Deltaproteobacteria bacterium]|nr:MAG: flagellar biosynthesis protein FlgM [Deltaproteobacteria bacterium]
MKVKGTKNLEAVKPAHAAPEARRAAVRDRVSTDAAARLEAAVTEAQRQAGLDRAARLEALEAAVKSGVYRPDPQRIAQEILYSAELAARLRAMLKR